MALNDLRHELKPNLNTKITPLPLILPSLNLLTLPAQALEEELKRQLEDNVLLSVKPSSPAVPLSSLDGDADWIENIPSPVSFEESLSIQLRVIKSLDGLPDEAINILIQGLDSRGYLTEHAAEMFCDLTGMDKEKFHSLLQEIQDTVDPPGLFAQNLQECLLIQLRRKGMEGKDPWLILANGWEHLVNRDIKGLSRLFGWPQERILKALQEIKKLDPNPGADFLSKTQFVIPEVAFIKDGKTLRVHLLHENLPQLHLDTELLEHISIPTLRSQWLTAKKVLIAFSLRLRTKLRISQFLADAQKAFLLRDTNAPYPMTLSAVAQHTGYHPSTVQRIVKTTWGQTPVGTILLDKLLSRPLKARPDMSVAQLRKAIRDARLSGKSDEKLASELKIPRRTITWHRNQMHL